jgi:HEAT repeat protein
MLLSAASCAFGAGMGLGGWARGQAQPAPSGATRPAASTSAPVELPDAATILRNPRASQSDREEAARRLVLRDTPEARETLVSVLSNFGNPMAQLAVAKALPLDLTPDPALIDPLFALIGQPRLSDAAIQALALYRDREDVRSRLIRLATEAQSKDPQARISALRALGTLPNKSVAGALVQVVTDPREPRSIREAAGTALKEMTGLKGAATDASQWRKWWSVHSRQPDADFERDVLRIRSGELARLRAHFDQLAEESRGLLAESYQLAPDKNKESLLLRYLRSSEPEIRALGAKLVQDDFQQARSPTQAVRDQLRSMVGDSSSEVRLAVAQTFQALNDAQAIDALLRQLAREPDPDVKIKLIQAMVPMRNVRVVPVLLQLLHDPSPGVAEAAARGLADPENIAPLIQKDPALARHVADVLRETFDQHSAIDDPNTIPLRVALVDAMGATRQPNLGQQVYSQLTRPGKPIPIRCAALRALGQLGKPDGNTWPANYIVDALSDPNDEVRLTAVNALDGTADVTQADRLFDFVKRDSPEPNPKIRAAAWQTLSDIINDPNSRATNEWLNRWADRFPEDEQPGRRIDILKVLAGRLAAQNNAAQLATVQQNIGEALMVERAQASARGDQDLARARAQEAGTYFEHALAYYREKYPTDQNMTTSALVEQRMNALLASDQYDAACRFAAESIAANRGNQERLGPKLRNKLEMLNQSDRTSDALRLIDQINKMDPPLADPYAGQIRQLEQSIREKASTQPSGTVAPKSPTPAQGQ